MLLPHFEKLIIARIKNKQRKTVRDCYNEKLHDNYNAASVS